MSLSEDYVIIYRGRSGSACSVLNAYLRNPETWEDKSRKLAVPGSRVYTCDDLQDAMKMTLREAAEMQLRVPVLDRSHEPAEVIRKDGTRFEPTRAVLHPAPHRVASEPPSVGARCWVEWMESAKNLFGLIPASDVDDVKQLIPELWCEDEERVQAARKALWEILDDQTE